MDTPEKGYSVCPFLLERFWTRDWSEKNACPPQIAYVLLDAGTILLTKEMFKMNGEVTNEQ